MRDKTKRPWGSRGARQNGQEVEFVLALYDTTNSTDVQQSPLLSDRQQNYLVFLINQVGRLTYRDAKIKLGIPLETTLTRLTAQQASLLIDRLKELAGGE